MKLRYAEKSKEGKMNKLYKLFAVFSFMLFTANIFAQVASVTWPLTSNQNPNTPTGNIQASPETIGAGSGTYLLQIVPSQYNPYGSYGQRLWMGNQGSAWLVGLPDYTRYIQFDASPTSGNSFTVQYISFQYSDYPTPTNTDFHILKGEAWYSTDGWNNKFQLNSNPLDYLSSAIQTFSANVNVLVQNGQTFSVRIYPYAPNGALAMTPSFATHKNVIIEGVTSAADVNNASICGMKFSDLNGNGIKDSGEPGLPGWTINLSGATPVSVTTDANGEYCFNNLAAGTYTIGETNQSGWQQTYPSTPGSHTVVLSAGQNVSGINFGNKAYSSSPNDACLTWSLLNSTAVTSISGNINGQPEILGPGSSAPLMAIFPPYTSNGQRLLVTGGWQPGSMDATRYIEFNASPASGNNFIVNNVSFNYGDNPLTQNFNILNAKVYYSTDNWSSAGTQIGSTLIYLNTIMQTFVASNLNVSVSSGQTFSLRIYPYSPNGSIAGAVSLAIHNNVTICGSTNTAVVNTGYICGKKFNDVNGNGINDGEPGLANWTINLTGTSTATATTDATGNFCFNNLAAGTYTVAEVQQSGWTQTAPTPNTYTITLTAGQSRSDIIFGNKLNAAAGCVQPPSGMVAWYPLDEVIGSTVVSDIMGTNNGTPVPGQIGIMGSASDGPVPGSTLSFLLPNAKVNGSLLFYAGVTKKYVKVPDAPSLNFGVGDFSIDAWVYPVIGSNYVQPIVDKAVTTVSYCVGYRLFILNGQLNFLVMDGNNVSTTTAPISYSQWQHVAAVRKGGTPNTFQLYINGVLVTTTTAQVNNTSNTTELLIGGITSPNGGTLCGLPAQFNYGEIAIDELEIFNRAMTASEIFSIWHADTFGKCKPSANTGSLCGTKFNDINGNGIKDGGETGLPNWTINLTGAMTATVTTDNNGNFCFNNLAAGTYTVSEVLQSGWTQTAPTPNTYTVTLTSGQSRTDLIFGNKFNSAVGCVAPPAGMVAWWHLDESSGTTTSDLAGFNNIGTRMNGPVPVAGKVAGGLQFDGTNDYVIVPHNSELNFGTGNFTIDAWIKTSETSGERIIVDKQTLNGLVYQGYSFHLNAGYLSLQLADASPPNYFTNQSSGTFVADGNWHHVAVTVTRNSSTGVIFYKDGVGSAGFNLTGRQGSLDNTGPLVIGRQSYADQRRFNGILDEIEMFNRVLTAAEIQSIYNAGSAGKCKLISDVKEEEQIPVKSELLQSYPNPFNPTTTIQFDIPTNSFVNISVYDMLGREVRVLVNEQKNPGRYRVIFDASELTSGIYFCTIRTANFTQSRKMILMK